MAGSLYSKGGSYSSEATSHYSYVALYHCRPVDGLLSKTDYSRCPVCSFGIDKRMKDKLNTKQMCDC